MIRKGQQLSLTSTPGMDSKNKHLSYTYCNEDTTRRRRVKNAPMVLFPRHVNRFELPTHHHQPMTAEQRHLAQPSSIATSLSSRAIIMVARPVFDATRGLMTLVHVLVSPVAFTGFAFATSSKFVGIYFTIEALTVRWVDCITNRKAFFVLVGPSVATLALVAGALPYELLFQQEPSSSSATSCAIGQVVAVVVAMVVSVCRVARHLDLVPLNSKAVSNVKLKFKTSFVFAATVWLLLLHFLVSWNLALAYTDKCSWLARGGLTEAGFRRQYGWALYDTLAEMFKTPLRGPFDPSTGCHVVPDGWENGLAAKMAWDVSIAIIRTVCFYLVVFFVRALWTNATMEIKSNVKPKSSQSRQARGETNV